MTIIFSPETINKIGAVVLAAGEGKRLKHPELPKVMAPIGGKPILAYILSRLKSQLFDLPKDHIIVVVGYRKEKIFEYFKDEFVYAEQGERQGTAHAALIGIAQLPSNVKTVLIVNGDDSAFYSYEILQSLISEHLRNKSKVTLLSTEAKNPDGLGRVVRGVGGARVVEKENLKSDEEKIKEISTGTYVVDREWFERIYDKLPKIAGLGEYGMPAVLDEAIKSNVNCEIMFWRFAEWFGINTPEELAEADRRKNLKS